jgi:hypothetical protein
MLPSSLVLITALLSGTSIAANGKDKNKKTTTVARPRVTPTKRWISSKPTACSTPKQSVEWRLFSIAQKNAYLTAVSCVRKLPSKLKVTTAKKPTTAWEDLVYIHSEMATRKNSIHNTAQFLPWHRMFLGMHDSLLQECGYKGNFPYWDWTLDSQAPDKASIWKDLGTNPNGRATPRVIAPLTSNFPSKHNVVRKWAASFQGGPQLMGAFYSAAVVQVAMNKRNYNSFRLELEGTAHNQVHNGIGGDMGTLASPNDPIFFFHHRNIDRFWALWQAKKPAFVSQYSGNTNPLQLTDTAKSSDVMNFLGLDVALFGKGTVIRVSDTFNIRGLICNNYQNTAKSLAKRSKKDGTNKDIRSEKDRTNKETPDCFDRKNKFNLRVPKPITDEFMKMMGYSNERIKEIRKSEAANQKFVEYANTFTIDFPSSIANLEAGEQAGWRVMTDTEIVDQELMFSKLVTDFEAQV